MNHAVAPFQETGLEQVLSPENLEKAWKQWRKGKTGRFLRHVQQELLHSSKTEGINKGLSNKYLKDLGLVSLTEKWVAIHYG